MAAPPGASTRSRIRRSPMPSRSRLSAAMSALVFRGTPSQANFVGCRRSDRPVKPVYEELKRRKVLVRYMNYTDYGDGLRISVGTPSEVEKLLNDLKTIL